MDGRRFFCQIAIALSLNAIALPCFAQNTELTSSDNHALLYAHQLGFSSSGTPTVRMRIADGMSKLRFEPQGDFVVMPSGTGGCAIKLKGGRSYEVTLTDAHSGTYQYGGIVARSDSTETLANPKTTCELAKVETEIVPIGSVFALKGHVFDNRENLLMTRRTQDHVYAEKQLASAPLDVSVDGPEIYSELMTYPTAKITLRDLADNIQIVHSNLMWMDLPESGAILYDIEDENGKKSEMRINSQLIVTPDQTGKLAVVQSADIETILRGIVPAEIFASAPEAALMAQAIAARTTLISHVGTRHMSDPYHLCNKQHCQVYRGLSGADERTDKAIEKTRGQILFSDKKLVMSYYSAHCGGMSAGSLETWGLSEKSYLVSRTDDAHESKSSFKNDSDFKKWWQQKDDNYCSSAPEGQNSFASTKHARWEQTLSSSQLDDLAKQSGKKIGHVQSVEVIERGASFRATKLRVKGTNGTTVIERELPIRRFLGGLKSARFIIENASDGSIHIYGTGFGHGVGMCQTGAIGMAQRGMNAKQILEHYYPGTRLETLW
ncbi:MAG: SpoIID/LytB domain-containing protein [Proteobacteria bacterium]|nr:SpoIID/LytB domain-containing protein [Pseudomonadota bacterium]